jgi:tripartite-type tricarboxylate transporter receptor subunit TctC
MKNRLSIALLVTASTFVPLAAVYAQGGYPTRPVRIVIPYAPGGGTDILARFISPRMGAELGQQVVIDNRPGGNSIIGTQIVARAAPDGYTTGMIDISFTINQALFPKLPYDAVKDFAPITLMASSPLVLMVHPSVDAKSVKELIALAKAKPGVLTYSSPGTGGAGHIAFEQFAHVAGVKVTHIPYKGAAPASADLIAGQVQMAMIAPSVLMQQIKAGRVRALAVTGARRIAALPDVPAMAELGLPGVDSGTYWGAIAPAGTSRAIITQLNAQIVKHLQAADLRDRLNDLNMDLVCNKPEEFGVFIQAEVAKFRKIIQEAGIKIE